MDLRGYEDELIKIKQERYNPTSLHHKKIIIVGRFTNNNIMCISVDNTLYYITCVDELRRFLIICKGAEIVYNIKNADIVCWLLPYKYTKNIKYAFEQKIPIIKLHNLINMRK